MTIVSDKQLLVVSSCIAAIKMMVADDDGVYFAGGGRVSAYDAVGGARFEAGMTTVIV